jgi:hypothetical protein
MSLNCDIITPKHSSFVTISPAILSGYRGTTLPVVTFITGGTPTSITTTAFLSGFGDLWMLALPMQTGFNSYLGGGIALRSDSVVITSSYQRPAHDSYCFYTYYDNNNTPAPGYRTGTAKIGADGYITLYAIGGTAFTLGDDYAVYDTVLYWKNTI